MREFTKRPQKVHPIKFTYEIILSKGLGYLTKKAETMMIDLANNAITKGVYKNYSADDKADMLQTGLFNMLNNFSSFNLDKSSSSFSYFTEVFKRGTNEAYNLFYNKKGLKKGEKEELRFFSMNRINDGNGMFNM